MSELYLKWMDRLYLLAMAVAGLSLLVMTIVIPIGIFSRYVLNRGESWPEPIAIICMVTFTFIGARSVTAPGRILRSTCSPTVCPHRCKPCARGWWIC